MMAGYVFLIEALLQEIVDPGLAEHTAAAGEVVQIKTLTGAFRFDSGKGRKRHLDGSTRAFNGSLGRGKYTLATTLCQPGINSLAGTACGIKAGVDAAYAIAAN